MCHPPLESVTTSWNDAGLFVQIFSRMLVFIPWLASEFIYPGQIGLAHFCRSSPIIAHEKSKLARLLHNRRVGA
jgi:hypothetical protein